MVATAKLCKHLSCGIFNLTLGLAPLLTQDVKYVVCALQWFHCLLKNDKPDTKIEFFFSLVLTGSLSGSIFDDQVGR